MRTLIVDDEPLARRRLRRLIERVTDLDIVGEAEHGERALSLIASLAPELVFLDIDMPGIDGVSLAKRLTTAVSIVFTTAHREHAIEAFAVDAVDYLLKPIEEARLVAAVERVRARRPLIAASNPVMVHSGDSRALPLRLTARANGVVALLDPALIARLFASDKYTLCQIADKEYVLDESLSQLEATLEPLHFLRVHRRELINLRRVSALHAEGDTALLELDDGQRAQVSRRALAEVKRRLGLR